MSRHSEIHYDFRRRTRQLEEATRALEAMMPLLIEAHTAAALMLATPSSSSSERVTGGETIHKNTPVEAAMFAREWTHLHLDPVDEQLADLLDPDGVIATMRTALTGLAAAGRQATPAEAEPRTNMVECTACHRTITMTPNDRPRGGWCMACVMAWRRLEQAWEGPGGPDRAAFERQRATWRDFDDDTPEVRSTVGAMTITRGDRTLSLTQEQMAHLLSFGPRPPEAEIDKLFEEATG